MADHPVMRLLTPRGVVEVEVPEEEERKSVSGYWYGVKLVSGGDRGALKGYRGVRIAGYELETDPRLVTRWLKQNDVEFEDIYES